MAVQWREGGRPLTRWLGAMAVCLLCGFPAVPMAEEVRTFQGRVVAINQAASPPVIVVESKVGKDDSFTVGATVGPSVDISRGAKKVGLGDLKVGERVIISFTKTAQGHVARSIHAR
ncbi:MAG: hypothetical protein A4S17_14600 [Proteobacteria bacterium HN_bin10]|nr:MAG: hypothetical protein A4S17_14600 [Proteobacteria bacterium HN_bin10]